MRDKTNPLTLVGCLACLLVLTACGDDDGPVDNLDGGTPSLDGGPSASDDASRDSDGASQVPGTSARYAFVTQVFGASDQTSYLRLFEGDLFSGALPGTGGVERAGRALVAAGKAPGSAFFAGDKLPSVDRYDVTAGKLTRGQTVSFGGEGVAGVSEYAGQFVTVSATKALYFDARTLKVMVWNPETMTLTRSIDVGSLQLANFSATFSTFAEVRGSKVYMPVGYRTPAAVPSVTAVVVVDTDNDTAKVVKDERCGYVRDSAIGDDGMWYLATEAFASALHYLNEQAAPAPCLLRFDFATDSYDAAYRVDLNALAQGRAVGSLVRLPDGKLYTRVLDESKLPKLETPSGRAIASAIAWGWAELTPGQTPSLRDVPDAYVMGGSLIPLQLGNSLVIPAFSGDLSRTTLCDMTNGPVCTRRAEVEGLVFSLAQLQ